MMLTIKNFGPDNRTKTVGHSMYRICNTDESGGTGKWYIHETYNNGKDWAQNNSFYRNSLEEVIDIFNLLGEEKRVVSLGFSVNKTVEEPKAEDSDIAGGYNKNSFSKVCSETENFRDKLGEVVAEAIFEDNNSYEIAKSIVAVFDSCDSEKEFKVAHDMLAAITGYSLETLIEKIKDRDKDGYAWESC